MVTIGTTVMFEAGHRQYGDTSKCSNLHGHGWKAEIIIDGSNLDEIGYLTDFKNIKEVINKFDHAMILNSKDPFVEVIAPLPTYLVTIDGNPTCEILAQLLADRLFVELNIKRNITQVTVTLWETEKSWARATS